jgi:hypothetical protein
MFAIYRTLTTLDSLADIASGRRTKTSLIKVYYKFRLKLEAGDAVSCL